jgi:hypothetical protein
MDSEMIDKPMSDVECLARYITEKYYIEFMIKGCQPFKEAMTAKHAFVDLRWRGFSDEATRMLEAITRDGRAKIVRREATEKMVNAGWSKLNSCFEDSAINCWRAMFGAAPPYNGQENK